MSLHRGKHNISDKTVKTLNKALLTYMSLLEKYELLTELESIINEYGYIPQHARQLLYDVFGKYRLSSIPEEENRIIKEVRELLEKTIYF